MSDLNNLSDLSNHFVKIKLKGVEDDLSDNNWNKVVDEIISNLKSLNLIVITNEDIDQFKNDMLKKDGFSLKNLKRSIQKNFAVGHLGISRIVKNVKQVKDIARIQYPDKTQVQFNIEGFKGNQFAYIYNPKITNYDNILNFNDKQPKIFFKIIQNQNKDIPFIKISSFRGRNGAFKEEIDKVIEQLSRNYKNIILDLRGNAGGHITAVYYFLSLFLGNNDPDIRLIGINPEAFKFHFHPPTAIENALNEFQFESFYNIIKFEDESYTIQKDTTEKFTFNRMIVLIDKKTFSGGEIAAATLKSTLGSKVCILGSSPKGSFEEAGDHLDISFQFRMYLPDKNKIFYSVKHRKLLTGQRLLPDIEHNDMNDIVDKALDLFDESFSYPDVPSFEPMK